MPGSLGSILVIAVLAAVVALACRSIWRGRRSGGCGGDCSHCGGCGGSCRRGEE